MVVDALVVRVQGAGVTVIALALGGAPKVSIQESIYSKRRHVDPPGVGGSTKTGDEGS